VGAGLAAGCDRVGAACAADLRAEREITAALAGPRASALVLAGLPVAGLLLAAGLGADPLEFFLTVAGAATLVAGVTLDVLGVLWTRRLAAQALR
jgi:tight adherence protein B